MMIVVRIHRASLGALAALALTVACSPPPETKPQVRFFAAKELRSPDWRRRVQAVEFLGERTDPRSFMLLRLARRDPVIAVRVAAVEALGRRHTRAALSPLLDATRDRDPQVRRAAYRVLRQRGDPRVLPKLLQHTGRLRAADRPWWLSAVSRLIRKADGRRRAANLRTVLQYVQGRRAPQSRDGLALLRHVGAAAIPSALRALARAPSVRLHAPWVTRLEALLLRMGKPLVRALLEELDRHPATSRRAHVAGTLLTRLGAIAVPGLVRRLDLARTGSFEKCQHVARILRGIGAPAVTPLLASLRHPSSLERRRALKTLERIGHRQATPGIIALLSRSPDTGERRRCVRVLAKLGDRRALTPVAAALARDQPTATPLDSALWRPYVVALDVLKADATLIRKLLSSPDLQRRLVAAQVAGRRQLAEVVPALVRRLADPWPAIAGAAAHALGRLRAKGALPALRRLLLHRNVQVRVEAANALGRIADPRATLHLQLALRRPQVAVRIAALRALVRLKARTALPAVRALARVPHPVVLPLARWAVARLTGRSSKAAPNLCALLAARMKKCRAPRRGARPAPPDRDLTASLASCGRARFTAVATCAGAFTCGQCHACTLELGGLYNGRITYWWNLQKRHRREEGAYLRGKRHGRWRSWYRNGKRHTDGTFQLGRRMGAWTTWWDSGQRKESGFYLHDRKNGLHQRWGRKGQRRAVTAWMNGRRQGVSTTWHHNGKLATRSGYLNDKRHGAHLRWYPNGKKRSQTYYFNGKRNGTSSQWGEQGRLRWRGSYVLGRRHGPWADYWPDGSRRSAGAYLRDQRRGRWRYWPTGGGPPTVCTHRDTRHKRCQRPAPGRPRP